MPCLKSLNVLIALIVVLPICSMGQEPELLGDRLQVQIPKLMRDGTIPGLSIAVLRKGEVVYSGAFGVKNNTTMAPVEAQSMFQAASLTKPLFAYAVLRLADRGVLDLDQPLTSYLDWDGPVRDGIKPDHYETIRQDPRLQQLTARLVLSHQSGFPNWSRNEPLPFVLKPGTRFSYSGEGYVLLQKAICDLGGQTLSEIVRSEVFEPLGMKHSALAWDDTLNESYVDGHRADGQPFVSRPSQDANAAGSLLTTASDYARFLVAVLKGTGLSRHRYADYLKIQVALDPECSNCLNRDPESVSDQLFWGLGWGLQLQGQSKSFWHWGNQGVYMNWVEVNLNTGDGIVYFANSATGLAIRDELVGMTLAGPHPAFDWVKEEQYDQPGFQFSREVYAGDMQAALTRYEELKKTHQGSAVFDENHLNGLGYDLMNERLEDAITIFELNVAAYPHSFNPYDSLAEAYMNQGATEKAILNYAKSLELNPDNRNAAAMLEKLRALGDSTQTQ